MLSGISILDHLTGRQQLTVGTWSVMFLISLSLIYIIGIVDDIVGVRPRTKFSVQIIAAALLPISGLYINNLYGMFSIYDVPFWIGAPLTVFVLVFIDNAMNLIDGIDGLAGGLALLSLAGFLLCFMHEGIYTYAILIAGLMGVLTAYLYFNIWGNGRLGQSDVGFHSRIPAYQVCHAQSQRHALPQQQSADNLHAAHSAVLRRRESDNHTSEKPLSHIQG